MRHDVCDSAEPAGQLLIMLPGAYGTPEDFVEQGFVAAARRRGLGADIVMADAHLGLFTDRSVIGRIREDIVLPARQGIRREIWLVGISLGALAALGYAARHPDDIAGVVAIAPYPGSREVLDEIAAAGGAAHWRRSTAPRDDDLEREVWAWLVDGSKNHDTRPHVYMGYGRQDRFAPGQAMMAGTLAADRSCVAAGAHDWTCWRALWEQWLDRGLLAGSSAHEDDAR